MKKIVSLVICVVLAFQLVNCVAFADSTVRIQSLQVVQDSKTMDLIVSTPGVNNPEGKPVSVSMGGSVFPAASVTWDSSDQAFSTTYIFDVDFQTDDSKSLMKTVTNKLIEEIVGQSDNAAVISGGDSSLSSTSLKSGSQLDAKDFLHKSGQNEVIDRVKSVFSSAADLSGSKDRICLVLVSDGQSVKEKARWGELADLAASSNVTVYTVAVNWNNSDTRNAFDSISAGSIGGIASSCTSGNSDAVASAINNGEKAFRLLSVNLLGVDLSGFATASKDTKVTVEITDGNEKKKAQYSLTLEDIELIEGFVDTIPAPDPSTIVEDDTADDPKDDTADDTADNQKDDPDVWEKIVEWVKDQNIVVLALSAVFALLLIVLVIVKVARHKKPDDIGGGQEPDDEGPTEIIDDPHNVSKQVNITLQRLDTNEFLPTVTMNQGEEISIGRSLKEGNQIILKEETEDKKVSRKHAGILYKENGNLYIIDKQSQNGTQLNKVPVKEWRVLSQNDIIEFGPVSCRITWTRQSRKAKDD